MLKNIKGLRSWFCKNYRTIYKLWRWRIVKQNELDGDLEFIMTIGLGGKLANYWKPNRKQFWKEEYARLIETPYYNMMLDKWVLRTKERPARHKFFLLQEVVQWDVWTGGLHKRHNSKRTISTERDVVDYSSKWADVVYFSATICSSNS
jgi:hypothetical protein